MATPAAIVTGAQRVSIASARLDAVGEASATRVSRRPHAGSAPVARAASATRVSRRPHAGSAPVARASPAVRSRGRRQPCASSPRELSNGGDRR